MWNLLVEVGASEPGLATFHVSGEPFHLAEDPRVLRAMLGDGREAALLHQPLLGGEVLAAMGEEPRIAGEESQLVARSEPVGPVDEFQVGLSIASTPRT